MDPISAAIIAGVTAGLTSGTTEVGKQAIVDIYNGLKSLLKKAFGEKSDLVEAVDKLEQHPESKGRQETLQEEVEHASATEKEELVKAAQGLLKALEETEAGKQALSKFNIQAPGAQIGVIGDRTKVEGSIFFGTKPKADS